ncbi:MAG TPA: PepSY-like domain-containing protein [Candidatus Nitrosocosmicus sp.]
MKKHSSLLAIFLIAGFISFAQHSKKIEVPSAVKSSLKAQYPEASNVTWEKEKGNYEANWGGKSGEDNSVMYTPAGDFIEIVKAIPVSQLPAPVIAYVKAHYKGVKITEAGKVTDAKGKLSYEAEVNHKDIIFDEKGNFVKAEH